MLQGAEGSARLTKIKKLKLDLTHLQAKLKINKGKSTTNITIIRKGERFHEKLNWLEPELAEKIW